MKLKSNDLVYYAAWSLLARCTYVYSDVYSLCPVDLEVFLVFTRSPGNHAAIPVLYIVYTIRMIEVSLYMRAHAGRVILYVSYKKKWRYICTYNNVMYIYVMGERGVVYLSREMYMNILLARCLLQQACINSGRSVTVHVIKKKKKVHYIRNIVFNNK